jgi:hypothetical protein
VSALPDVTSGMSGLSIDDENYCHSSISKSRSENILRSEQSNPPKQVCKQSENSESIYYTSQHSQEVTPTGNPPRVRTNDPSLRLSLDSSKYRSMKAHLPVKDDKSSLSLDFCDSNETSADFLTPINEMPPPGCEIEDLPKHNGNESVDSLSNDNDLETQTESAPRKICEGLFTFLYYHDSHTITKLFKSQHDNFVYVILSNFVNFLEKICFFITLTEIKASKYRNYFYCPHIFILVCQNRT